METINFFTELIAQHQVLAYCVIFLGLVVEGEFFLICSGILVHLGAVNLWIVLVAVLAGGMGKTLLGYYLGTVIKTHWGNVRFFKYMEKRVRRLMPRFREKPFWSIFLSKFILGANHIVVLFAGFERVNFKKYVTAEAFSTLIWAPAILTLGYLFSYTALSVSQEVSRFSLIVLVLFILFMLFDKLIGLLYEMFEEIYEQVE